jgi:hypothetical protein
VPKGALRSVGGGGEADLDMRAITTDDDIVDLDELQRAADSPEISLPSDDPPVCAEPEARPLATSSTTPTADLSGRQNHRALGHESDDEFDRWAAHNARRVDPPDTATSPPGTARLPRQTLHPPIPSHLTASGTHKKPGSNAPQRRGSGVPLPRRKLTRAAATAAVTLASVGGVAIATNTTASKPRPRTQPQTPTFDTYASNAELHKFRLAQLHGVEHAHAARRTERHTTHPVRRAHHPHTHNTAHPRTPAAAAPATTYASTSTSGGGDASVSSQSAPLPAPTASNNTTTTTDATSQTSTASAATASQSSSNVPATGASGALGPIGSPNG